MTGHATKAEVHVPKLVHCARCGEDHEGLTFRRFVQPVKSFGVELYSHWCACPVTSDPILLVAELTPVATLDDLKELATALQVRT